MKPKSCEGCPLEFSGSGFVRAVGSGANGVLIVGEAPGREEGVAGEPFIGAAGYFLEHRILKRAGLEREAFRIDNILHCQPPQNKLVGAPYEFGAIRQCRPYLDAEIASFKPKVILALGSVALQNLTGLTGIHRHRGYILRGPNGIPTIATYHPAFLMPRQDRREGGADKNPWRLIGAAILDVKKATRLAAGELPPAPQLQYLLDPGVAEWDRWVAAALRRPLGAPLSFDIETPGKLTAKDEGELDSPERGVPIIRIGFSYEVGKAVSIPWRGEYLPGIKALLEQENASLLGWNCYGFDQLILEQHGIDFSSATLHDGMWAWHVLQSDLPRGLEFVGGFYANGITPWKHLGSSEPARYNAIDADVALRNFVGTRADLDLFGQWDYYQRHVVALWPVLKRAGANGVRVDPAARAALEQRLTQRLDELDNQVQALVPRECRSTRILRLLPRAAQSAEDSNPGATKPLGEAPQGDSERHQRDLERIEIVGKVKVCSHCGKEGVKKADHFKGSTAEAVDKKGRPKKVRVPNPCKAAGATIETRLGKVPAWLERLPFNPESRQDLERYIKHYGHPMGSHVRTGADTVDKRHLGELVAKFGANHPIYEVIQERRKLSKARSTYVYEPDSKGLIHTYYSFAPSTGRLSSRDYNLTNVAHGSENPFAPEIRRQLVAPEGMVMVEADSSAIESVLSGVLMGDPTFVDLAKRGIYDYVCCYESGVEFSADGVSALKERLGAGEYKKRRDRNKRTALGTFYGMTARMLWKLYPKEFPTLGSAQQAIALLNRACPALPEWHHNLRVTAHRQAYLQNAWGGRHWFFHVFGKNHKTGKVTLGEDGKRCVAFLPQSSAAEFMKENALAIANAWPLEWIPANFLVHDAYCILAPEREADRAVELLVKQLTRPVPQLGGIRIGCEVKIGKNWADMESVKKVNP